MSEDSDTGTVLNKSTLMPIGAVITILSVLMAAWGFMDSRFTSIDKVLDKVDRRVEKLEDTSGDRWTSGDQQLWAARFQVLNPEMKLPNGAR